MVRLLLAQGKVPILHLTEFTVSLVMACLCFCPANRKKGWHTFDHQLRMGKGHSFDSNKMQCTTPQHGKPCPDIQNGGSTSPRPGWTLDLRRVWCEPNWDWLGCVRGRRMSRHPWQPTTIG
ncbi:hypothetical protein EV126DRAFT_412275 [Verticillium dahliae]|nr:hypothetical protein EV126DRAFT_412275 [Verticillium dahliae]